MNEYTFEVMASPFGEIIKKIDADGKVWFVPTDPANSDYQAYLKSLEETA